MGKYKRLSEETVSLHLLLRAWSVFPNMWVQIKTDSYKLASKFGKHVELVFHDWEKNNTEDNPGGK